MPDHAAYTIPGVSRIPDRTIVGPPHYIFFGDPLATVHYDCYAPWMAPPKPPRVEMLKVCDACGSADVDHECITSSYRVYCNACGHIGPRRRSPNPGGIILPGEPNEIVEEPCGSLSPEQMRAFYAAIISRVAKD